MASVSVGQVYAAAKSAGFSDIEALIMTATAMVESGLNLTPGGNGGGLLQFEPSTWSGTHVSCNIYDLACQMQAAKALVGGNFGRGWFSNWFACEAAQQGGGQGCSPSTDQVLAMSGVYETNLTAIGSTVGASSSAAITALRAIVGDPSSYPGIPGKTPPSGSGIPSPPNPGNIISPILKIPGDILGGIGGGIRDALLSVGQHLLPWLIILGVAFFALFMIAKELGATGGGSGSGGGAGKASGEASAAEMAAA